MKRVVAVLVCALAACSEGGGSDTLNVDENLVSENSLTAAATLSKPERRYDEQDGDVYLYIAAVSEEEQKSGKAAGNVIGFRYLGVAKGVYRLQSTNRSSVTYECANPCKVIKWKLSGGGVDRIAFTDTSVIGSAFTDAFNGYLMPANGTKKTANAEALNPQPVTHSSNNHPTYAGRDYPVGENEPYFSMNALTAAQRAEVKSRCENGNRDSCILLENLPL